MTFRFPEDKLDGLSLQSRECLQRLAQYEAPPLPKSVVFRHYAAL